jgi:hypothetical protein
MIGWIALKIANNWSFWIGENRQWAPYLISSLIGSLISMLFALFGGLICILGKNI